MPKGDDILRKSLVLYFSVYGSTEIFAKEIARQTGADLLEIIPETPYDSNRNHYNALARLTKKEHDENKRPSIKNKIDLNGYDTVFIGYPMWWYTFPMIIYTLLENYNFSGKTIIPFNTHMGSGDGGTYQTVRQLLPNSRILKGLPLEMSVAENHSEKAVSDWLKSLEY